MLTRNPYHFEKEVYIMAKKRKKNMSLCQKAVVILDQDLESYRRGRMAYEDFRSRYEMARDLNIPVVCEKTGRQITAVQRGSERRTTIAERKCFCSPPKKRVSGRGRR